MRSVAPLALVVSLASCSGQGEHSKNAALQDCSTCEPSAPSGGGAVGTGGAAGAGGTSAGGGAGAGVGGSAGATASVTVAGTVVQITTADFLTTAPYTKSVLISAVSADASTPMTTALFDGASPFHLPKVAPGLAWLRAQQVATDVLGSWFLVQADGTTAVVVPVVGVDVLTTLAGQLLTPLALSDTSAHLVILVVDAQDKPLAGVTLSPVPGGFVGYDDGPGYTGTETHGRGAIVVVNAAAAAKTTSLVLSTKTIPATTVPDVPLAAATVTFVKAKLVAPLPRPSDRLCRGGMKAAMGNVLDGKAIAAKVRTEVALDVAAFAAAHGRAPGLSVVLVGEDPASIVYTRNKEKQAREVGIRGELLRLPVETTEADLLAVIARLSSDDTVDGILVQLPLPAHIHEHAVLAAIDPRKDVDGFHPMNVGLLSSGRPALVPCTPFGCMRLLREAGVELSGKRAVVVGRSNIVGKPMAALLLAANATVTIAHSRTADLPAVCREADVLVVAVGRAGLVRGDWVKEGAVVIDVGMNRDADGKLVGDVAYAEALPRASWITPVPGGVGPMTIACLLESTVRAAKARVGPVQE